VTAIKPGAKVLKLHNPVTEYSKGGGAARYFAGLYGVGQPVLRVDGKMVDGDKPSLLSTCGVAAHRSRDEWWRLHER
jgi:hypothetical protein